MTARITALPDAPNRDDPSNFPTAANAFVAALPTFGAEANALADEVQGNATAAAASQAAAAASASLAAAAAGAGMWVSGTTYTAGQCAWSPTDYQTYRRKVAGAGTTDPSLDTTNWARLGISPPDFLIQAQGVI
jgi:hypothetical protein